MSQAPLIFRTDDVEHGRERRHTEGRIPGVESLQKTHENPLDYLPRSTVYQYRRSQTIYRQNQPSTSIYLVIEGMVKVCRIAENGSQIMMDVYQSDEFFGESAFLGSTQLRTETSVALMNTKVMAWSTDQIEDIAARRPKLAIGLLQVFVQRSLYFGQRIEALSVDNTGRRLARALLRFSERMGHETENGYVEMVPFTHELLGQYVGTARAIVTSNMNEFRRQGYLLYSRKGILLRRKMLRDWLTAEPFALDRPRPVSNL